MVTLVQEQLQANLRSISQYPVLRSEDSWPSWFLDGALLRRFWNSGIISPRQLSGALVRVMLRPWFLPLRLGMLSLDFLRGMRTGWACRLAAEKRYVCEALQALHAVIGACLF